MKCKRNKVIGFFLLSLKTPSPNSGSWTSFSLLAFFFEDLYVGHMNVLSSGTERELLPYRKWVS